MVTILGVPNLGLQTAENVVFQAVGKKCTVVGGLFLDFQSLSYQKRQANCYKESAMDMVSSLTLSGVGFGEFSYADLEGLRTYQA